MWHDAAMKWFSRLAPPLRILVVLAAVFVVLVVTAWIALAVMFPPARVRAMIQERASAAMSREVRFGDARFGLFPPVRLTVQEPALAEPGGFDQGTAFRAKAVLVDLDPFGLLAGRLVLRRLVLEEPAVHLLMRADGTTNFDGLAAGVAGIEGEAKPPAAGTKQGMPLDLAINELVVRDGKLLVDDLAADRRMLVAADSRLGLSLDRKGRLGLTGGTTITDLGLGPLEAARLSDLKRPLAGLALPIEHRGTFDPEKKRLAVERLAFMLGTAEISALGVVDDPGPKARLDLKAKGDNVDLGALIGYLGTADAQALRGLKGSGRMAFDLGVRGALGPDKLPALNGTMSVKDGAFRYPDTPAGVEALAFTARFAPDSVVIRDLTARVAGQPVRAQLLATHFEDPQVRLAVQGNLDLAAVGPLVAPEGVKLGGAADVNVRAQGRAKDPGAMMVDGRATLRGVSVESPDLPHKIEKVDGTVELSGQRASISSLTAQAGKSSFSLVATIGQPLALMAKPGEKPPASVDFNLRSPYLDLSELLPATPGSPVAPNAQGRGRVTIGRLINKKLDVKNVDARVNLEPGVVAAPDFSFDGYGGKVSGDARFDFNDPQKPVYAVKARVDSVRADDLLSTWTPLRGVLQGALNSTIDLSGAGITPAEIARTLTAVGLASVLDGSLGPAKPLEEIARTTGIKSFDAVKFKDARVPFRVERGRVVTDDVVMRGSDGEWRMSGAVGFDGALDYAASVTVPAVSVKKLGADAALAAGALADPEGRVFIDLKIGGNVKSPRIAWDSRAMADRLAGRVSASLQEQGKKIERQIVDDYARKLTGDSTVTDSARNAARKELGRDLEKAGKDLLKGLFGSSKPDSSK